MYLLSCLSKHVTRLPNCSEAVQLKSWILCGLLASNCFPVGLKEIGKKLLKDCWTKNQHKTKVWSAQRNFKSRRKWLLLSDILLANYMFCCIPVLFQSPVICLSCLVSRQFINRSKNGNKKLFFISLGPDMYVASSFLSYKELLLKQQNSHKYCFPTDFCHRSLMCSTTLTQALSPGLCSTRALQLFPDPLATFAG